MSKLPGVLQVAGGLTTSVGFALMWLPLGIVVGGVLAIVFGLALEVDR